MKKMQQFLAAVLAACSVLSVSIQTLADEIYEPVDGPGMTKENPGICWIIGIAVAVVAVAVIFIIRAAKKKKK